ncbi:hypothetical protein KOI35_01455 [Actinoplanes bogorensis]|uniref:Uncharacterized protein n=1 Tax=Paractinoplanes bogorensis TaxID=1610840 RepID=A0ABS5YHJ0_9ACTN|nr:hypothetical protein [Actinoplanes bogorensis]MBU2662164.1 hypothetical protein [Actinoplanes bogorensis]
MATEDNQAAIWRQVIEGENKSWVLFAHHTCVVLPDPPDGDLAAAATAILGEYGPVHAGSASGDFGTIELEKVPGWVVWSHHPDVLTFVAPDEVEAPPSDLVVGLTGRSKRDRDGHELTVIHVEDRRLSAP